MAVFEHGFVVNFEIRALQNHIINNLSLVITQLENSLSKEVSNLKARERELAAQDPCLGDCPGKASEAG